MLSRFFSRMKKLVLIAINMEVRIHDEKKKKKNKREGKNGRKVLIVFVGPSYREKE